MSKEILAIPEEHLKHVIRIIGVGMNMLNVDHTTIPREVFDNLTKWCTEEEQYLERLEDDKNF